MGVRLDHINISAPAALLSELRDFYCEIFELQDGYRPNFSRRGYWLYAGELPLVHLVEDGRPRQSGQESYLDHVAFRVSGLQAMRARLEALQISFNQKPVPELGMVQLFFRDPAGNGLEANFAESDDQGAL